MSGGVNFNDVAGEYEIDVEQFQQFIKSWYSPNDLVTVTHSPEGKGGMNSVTLKAKEYMEFSQSNYESFIFNPTQGQMFDLYVTVCPTKTNLTGPGSKANANDAARMPGLWVDLDVKPDAFDSKEDILEFIDTLPLKPSIVVDSGNGIHLYIKIVEKDVRDEELARAWVNYLRVKTGGKHLDSTGELARLLRAPGSVHTGKGTGVYSSVRLLKASQTAYPVEVVRELVREATERLRSHIATQRTKERLDETRITELSMSEGFGTSLVLKAHHEDFINDNMDWSEILEPKGWTLNRTLGNGEREWTRPGWTPGASKRSAITDHEKKGVISNVMSLRSEAPDTGLIELRDIVPLSKARVLRKLWFDDDPDEYWNYVYNRFINNS